MDRRAFLAGMGAAGASFASLDVAGAPDTRSNPYFEFRFYRMTQGERPRRLAQSIQRILPIFQKHKFGPVGIFDVLLGPESPTTVVLMTWTSLADREELLGEFGRDPEAQKAVTDLESPAEPPFDGVDSFLARATSFSPELKASATEQKPRIFELRIYHSPTERQFGALLERFGGPEIKIFHRSGIHPILYSRMEVGRNLPNLVYLTPFDDLAAREKAWAAFGADPEWQKVRDESIQKAGQIVSNVSITMLRAAAYSPIR